MGHFDNPESHPRIVRQETVDSGEGNAHQCLELADLLGTSTPVNSHLCQSTDTDLQQLPGEGWPPVTVKRHQHKHSLKRRYEVLETLGKGTYGKVKKAIERRSGKTVAVKSIRKERISDDFDRAHIQREIEIVSLLNHPNIIRMHEVFECREKIVMVMEYASGGELYDYIQQRQKLTETEARSFFRQITSAVHYCHKNGVVHRDLKLENILLDQNLNVKLVDFGLSNHYERGRMLDTYCGSPLYASPEIINGLPYQGPEVDCWALGVLLYTLVHGSMPFDGASYSGLRAQIRQGRYRKPQPPSDACALIGWMLTVKVADRATVEDVANHWWVNRGFEASICDCPPAWNVQNSEAKYDPSPSANGNATSKRLLSDPRPRHTFPPKRPTSLPPCSSLPRKSRLDKPLSPRSPASPSPAASSAHSQAAKMPKKGILKKLYERAAHGVPSERQTGSVEVSAPPSGRVAHRGEGQGRTEEGRRRKGILKRNGKFTSAPKTLIPPSPTPASFPESLEWDPDPDSELKHSQQRDLENTQEEELER